MEFLTQPLAYPFMVRGLLAAGLVGAIGAVVGSFVVLRGMAFFGDALAHAILPGVAVGYLLGSARRGALFWWALLTSLVVALGIGAVGRSARLKEDTAIGVIFAGMFALGIALISSMRGYALDLTHFLFGNVLGVSWRDLALMAGFGGAVLVLLFAFYKELVVLSFDPVLAATLRLPVRLLHNLLLVTIAVTAVVSLQTVGVALMVALLVTPAATAYLLTRRLPAMMALGAFLGASSGVVGLYLSYYVRTASGPAIVLVATGLFLAALLLAPRRGLIFGRLPRGRGEPSAGD
ncbi:MAG: metal ABC transporter permease [Candidatus Acetothermia bacterium]|jgi:manganese/iron transport system permease protein|nr:metal ABC transporter permease [Candidatus Acetothermia bacterium]MDH7506096.1 metal ABC transporter permease [Candidatus Acetothermia bacterium]